MKILIGNNYYYLRGGAERVMLEEMELLEHNGHVTIPFSVKDPERLKTKYDEYFVEPIEFGDEQTVFQRLHVASRIIYSFHSQIKAKQIIADTRPDIAHFHNIYHRLNPSVFHAFSNEGIPIVVTAHDYKMLCPVYLLYRNGQICERCSGRHYYNCFLNNCNPKGHLSSFIGALEGYIQGMLGLWKKTATRIVTPSSFLRDKLIEAGFGSSKVIHVPNFVNLADYKPQYKNKGYFLFLGRLSREKGIASLIKAFGLLQGGGKLLIAGTGPQEDSLKELSGGRSEIVFTGHLNGYKLARAIAGSRAVVVPSEWYENAPMSIIESMAMGKPVIGAAIGGIPELIEHGTTGFLFQSGSVDKLAEMLDHLLAMNGPDLEKMGMAARKRIEKIHSAEAHYKNLMSVYRQAAEVNASG